MVPARCQWYGDEKCIKVLTQVFFEIFFVIYGNIIFPSFL